MADKVKEQHRLENWRICVHLIWRSCGDWRCLETAYPIPNRRAVQQDPRDVSC